MAFKYNTAWTFVVVGGLIEIGWAYGLKISEGFTRPVPSAITIALLVVSFYFFAKSMTMLETGVAYAVYTGIGTAGTAIVGMAFLGESADPMRLLFLALLIGGIIGLKVISPEEPQNKKQTDEGGAG
jgi:quaternary ammonium compound-resistance protein SugE